MKKMFPVLMLAALFTSSCSKDGLIGSPSSLNSNTANASHGSDDPAGDDRGGTTSSSGGGTRISAASVPAKVMNAFKARFPNATSIEWKKLSNGNYKVQFTRSGVRWEAIYSPSGTLLKLERA